VSKRAGEDTLGLLAGAFGDGSMRVYACPSPEKVAASAHGRGIPFGGVFPRGGEDTSGGRAGVSGIGGGGDAPVVNMEPVFRSTVEGIGFTCVDWSRHSKDLLLAGASDGSVCMWCVRAYAPSPPGWGRGMSDLIRQGVDSEGRDKSHPPLKRFMATCGVYDYVPATAMVRSVAWCPDSPRLFASTGGGFLFNVWDSSEQQMPLSISAGKETMNFSHGMAVRWAPGRCGIWIANSSFPFTNYMDLRSGLAKKPFFNSSSVRVMKSRA
ncbi:unnamed protein product, partial [Discosporangium mesarthrocarpum]